MDQRREELVQRWQTEEGQRWRKQVIRRLQKRKDLSKQPFLQRHQGRWDLRGLDFSRKPWHRFTTEVEITSEYKAPFTFAFGGKYTFKRTSFRDIDFSYANLGQANLERCHFENVLFHHTNYIGVRDSRCTFHQVDFYKADMRGATLGLHGARYEDVSFRRADMRRVSCYRGYFIKCDFSEARIEEVNFNASHFINCTFKGPLRGVWFRGYYAIPQDEKTFGKTEPNPMENVDFSEATLWDVMFSDGCDLSKVIIPQDGEHFLFHRWPQVLARAKEEVERNWEGVFKQEALGFLDVYAEGAQNQDMYIINRRELEHPYYTGDITGREEKRRFAVALVELLQEAEEQVGQES